MLVTYQILVIDYAPFEKCQYFLSSVMVQMPRLKLGQRKDFGRVLGKNFIVIVLCTKENPRNICFPTS